MLLKSSGVEGTGESTSSIHNCSDTILPIANNKFRHHLWRKYERAWVSFREPSTQNRANSIYNLCVA